MSMIKTTYTGDLQTIIEHVQSGSSVTTDADARAVKKSFSANELFVGAVSACIITVMEVAAQQHNFTIGCAEAFTRRTMRRHPTLIDKIEIDIHIRNTNLPQVQKSILIHTAYHCPVVLSLHDSIEKVITLYYV